MPEPFHLEVTPDRARVSVAPCGELDLSTRDELLARVAELGDSGLDHLVIDLGSTTFIDSSGISALLAISRSADEQGFELSILQGPPPVERAFAIAGIGRHLPFRARETPPAGG